MKRFWLSAIAACGMCILGAISAGAEDSTEVPVETQISTIYIEDLETSTETTVTTVVSEEPTEVTTETSYTDITTISTEITTTIATSDEAETTTSRVTHLFGDANLDGEINVRDCSKLAAQLSRNSVAANLGFSGICYPQKSDYNLKTIKGMQSYVNNWIKCYAEKTYGITAVAFDDTVDEDEYSWYPSELFIQNPEYEMDRWEKETGVRCLEVGSHMYEYNFPEYYKGQEWSFFIAKDESEMASLLINGVKLQIDDMVNQRLSGYESYFNVPCTIKWKDLGGGNYEIYWLWSGSFIWSHNVTFTSRSDFNKYWNISKENESKWDELWEEWEEFQ